VLTGLLAGPTTGLTTGRVTGVLAGGPTGTVTVGGVPGEPVAVGTTDGSGTAGPRADVEDLAPAKRRGKGIGICHDDAVVVGPPGGPLPGGEPVGGAVGPPGAGPVGDGEPGALGSVG